LERTVKVRFNADVNNNMPWAFTPKTREVEIHIGEEKLVFYHARNEAARPLTGVASYNVAPAKAGVYFNKVACFCFNEQHLAPGEETDMGVFFFVDPAMADDPGMDDVTTITLSYTFYEKAEEDAADEPTQGDALSAARQAKTNEGS
jgi:cytochrome c oxidase assembly protein subunit 11